MLGLSWVEVFVIIIVAVFAIGPKEWPTVIRTFRQIMQKISGMKQEFRHVIDDVVNDIDLKDEANTINQQVRTIIDLEGIERPAFDVSDLHQKHQERSQHTPPKEQENDGS